MTQTQSESGREPSVTKTLSFTSWYDLDGGLAAYNGGEKRVGMWLAQNKLDTVLWPETRKYVPSVLELYDEYRN